MADIDSEKERRLVADLLEGDESAFCELYALYKAVSYTHLRAHET